MKSRPIVKMTPLPMKDSLPGRQEPAALRTAPRRRSSLRLRLGLAAGLTAVGLLAGGTYLASQGGAYHAVRPARAEAAGKLPDAQTLERQLAAQAPRGLFLVVDTFGNEVRLVRKGEVERAMVCSTGSGNAVRDPRTGRLWIFDTPLGERHIQRKVRNPVWVKPDWAFIEEGFAPPKESEHRYDRVSLGDYGLYMGDGYIIHGTLFQSLLGQRLTHGCIRLGDEDLKYVYENVPLGTRVYLY